MVGLSAERRAVVIGGGIGGLAAGVALHRRGWTVRVLERGRDFGEVGAGITMLRNALTALEWLGLAAPVRAAARFDAPIGIRTATGRWLCRMDQTQFSDQVSSGTLGIHRATLHDILRSALPAEGLTAGAEVVQVHPGSAHRLAQVRYLRHGTEEATTAHLVVAADGLNSRTRAQLWSTAPPVYIGSTGWRAVTDTPPSGQPTATVSWGRGTEFGMVPLADGRLYWYGAATAPAGQRANDEHTEVRRRFGSWHDPIPALLDATDPASVLRHDLYRLARPLRSYVRERIVLLGDAAHAMPPYLGQGACQALEDAVALGIYAVNPWNLEGALQRYDADRRPRSQRIARASARFGQLGQQLSNPLAVAARNAVLQAMPPRLVLAPMRSVTEWVPPTPLARPTAPAP